MKKNLSKTLIQSRGEGYFAYLYDKRIDDLIYLRAKKYRGILVRVVIFCVKILKMCGAKNKIPNHKSCKYLFFAGSRNQYDSLKDLHKFLKTVSSSTMVTDFGRSNLNDTTPVNLSPTLIPKVAYLFFRFSPALFIKLGKEEKKLSRSLYFDKYCDCYLYLPLFESILLQLKPAYVVVSNDHNPANRVLVSLASLLDIKTIYLQHASVSDLFPSLSFDLSFLDGKIALEHYIRAEQLDPQPYSSNRKIYLSGQKKQISRGASHCRTVGMGFSPLDKDEKIVAAINSVLNDPLNVNVLVRLHPHHCLKSLDFLRNFFARTPAVKVTSANDEDVQEFIQEIGLFIGSTTSLHLEVAIGGVCCFQLIDYGFGFSDYYGYVKLGLSYEVKVDRLDLSSLLVIAERTRAARAAATRKFSETLSTPWQGKEALLVATTLEQQKMAEKTVYKKLSSRFNGTVFGLNA